MKRGKKLLAMLLALALLCGATALVTSLDLNGTQVEEEEDPAVTVLSLDADSVTALSWQNLSEEAMPFTKGEEGWTYDTDPAFPLDTDMIDTMVSTLSAVEASRAIEEPEDLAEYGLNEPLCVITLAAGGETYTLDLGDETALGGERYASTGDGKVYLVDEGLLDSFDYGLYDLVEEEDLPSLATITGIAIDAETQQLQIDYLEDSGLAYSDSYVWFLKTEDGYTTLDTELTEDLLYDFQSFAWVDCVNYNADDAALAEYGLDTPAAVLTVEYQSTYQSDTGETDEDGNTVYETVTVPGTLTLELGGYTGSCCYARIAGSGMVYTVDAAISDAILYTTAADLLPDDVLLLDFDEVTAMDILLDGQTYTVTVATEEETDEDGNVTEKTVYYLGGTQVWMEDTITMLEALTSSGYATGLTPERSEEIRFRFYREDENYPVVELAFYQYDSTSCLTELMGETTVFTSRSAITSLIEEITDTVEN